VPTARNGHVRVWCLCVLGCLPRAHPRRDPYKAGLDTCVGVCFVALYVLYLPVAASALSVFDCTANSDGVRILDVDPSVVCDEVRGGGWGMSQLPSFPRTLASSCAAAVPPSHPSAPGPPICP
jgi:hypothetical protein